MSQDNLYRQSMRLGERVSSPKLRKKLKKEAKMRDKQERRKAAIHVQQPA